MNHRKVETVEEMTEQRIVAHIKIAGLKEVQPGVFEVSGFRPRNINWDLVREGLSIENDDKLTDKLAEFVFKHDIMKLLSKRIKA